jgi:hypothetical protein
MVTALLTLALSRHEESGRVKYQQRHTPIGYALAGDRRPPSKRVILVFPPVVQGEAKDSCITLQDKPREKSSSSDE